MAQSQRKQAAWSHEIDSLAGGDFEKYMERTTRTIKRWRIFALSYGAGFIFMLVMYILEVIG